MITYAIEIIQGVARPSMVALSLCVAAALISVETSPDAVSRGQIDISDLGCKGLLKPVCG